MRNAEAPTCYPVGTPRGRLSQLEKDFQSQPWADVRDAVNVKLVEHDGELYILARSDGRRDREQAMRRRRLKKLIKRWHDLRQQELTRDQLLIKLGAARKEAGPAAYRLIDIQLPGKDQLVTPETFCFRLNWQKLREARQREGSYLLRSNLTDSDPAKLWQFYLQLVEIDIDQAWRLSRISGVAVGLCERRRPAVPRGRRRSDSLQCDDRLRIGLHQFSAANAGLHHAAA
jgi:hypothetical protein